MPKNTKSACYIIAHYSKLNRFGFWTVIAKIVFEDKIFHWGML